MNRSPRSRDAAALNFRLGQLARTKANLIDLKRVTYSEEEQSSPLFSVTPFTNLCVDTMITQLTFEIQRLQNLIKERAKETQRRKQEKKDA